MKKGTLYIVATPIGNLEDISNRAIRILKEVELIAAEDTRHTKKLLNHFAIKTPLESYHKFSERKKITKLIGILSSGKSMALVSSAGTPGISDPGELLVKEAIVNDITIVPIPGPTALILALITSGLPTKRFIFEGFLPKKKNLLIKRLCELKEFKQTIIFYESAKRLQSSLKEMHIVLGNRSVALAKELTKKFEKTIRGSLSNILNELNNDILKGEFVIVVEGAPETKITPKNSLVKEIQNAKKQLGISAKDAIKLVSVQYNIPKREVYSKWVQWQNSKTSN